MEGIYNDIAKEGGQCDLIIDGIEDDLYDKRDYHDGWNTGRVISSSSCCPVYAVRSKTKGNMVGHQHIRCLCTATNQEYS